MNKGKNNRRNHQTVVITATETDDGGYENVDMDINNGEVAVVIGKVNGVIVGNMNVRGDLIIQ